MKIKEMDGVISIILIVIAILNVLTKDYGTASSFMIASSGFRIASKL